MSINPDFDESIVVYRIPHSLDIFFIWNLLWASVLCFVQCFSAQRSNIYFNISCAFSLACPLFINAEISLHRLIVVSILCAPQQDHLSNTRTHNAHFRHIHTHTHYAAYATKGIDNHYLYSLFARNYVTPYTNNTAMYNISEPNYCTSSIYGASCFRSSNSISVDFMCHSFLTSHLAPVNLTFLESFLLPRSMRKDCPSCFCCSAYSI